MDPAATHPPKAKPWRDTVLSLLAAAIIVLLYAAWTRPHDLTVRPQPDGSILISTFVHHDDSPLLTRTYPVGDLVSAAVAFHRSPDPAGQSTPINPRSVGGIAGLPVPPPPATPGQLHLRHADNLLSLVTSVVAPATWRDNGGRGVIARAGDRLLITQTAEVHVAVEDFLHLLREDQPQ
jgi:hypothetical protein